jgi:uncharacterized protein (DUF58 family)
VTRHEQPGTRRLLCSLELHITRRLAGAVHGDYQGFLPGPGSEAGESRAYVPGDDVRLIDWNLTARTLEPHVRNPTRDHELDVWLVVDLSASQALGTRGGRKRDAALFAAAAFGFAGSRLANRVGAVLLTDRVDLVPPRPGTAHLLAILHRITTATPGDQAGQTDLAPALARTAAAAVRRGAVAVISDFLLRPGWEQGLHRLAQRHSAVAVEITDPLELQLPAVGRIVVEDPETGARLPVDTSDAALRDRYTAAATAQHEHLRRTIARSGADHLLLRTDDDWTGAVVQYFHHARRRRDGYRSPT